MADPLPGPGATAAALTMTRSTLAGLTAMADPIPGPRAAAATMICPALAGLTALADPIPGPRAAAARNHNG